MAVNGVEINLGQTWKIKHGRVKVLQYVIHSTYPWVVEVDNPFHHRYRVDTNGRREDGPPGYELLELVSVTEVDLNLHTKATNPKDAIGDRKVPLWLCSAIAMAHWAAAQFAGLIKYGAWNWRAAGVRTSTYLSAIARHWARYANGERLDPIDGTHHLGNIMACCAILLEAEAIGKLNDDRSPSADLKKTFDEVEEMMVKLKTLYADKAPKHWTINDEIPS